MQLVFRLLSFSSINTPVTYRYAFRLTAPDCPVLLFSIYTVTGVEPEPFENMAQPPAPGLQI